MAQVAETHIGTLIWSKVLFNNFLSLLVEKEITNVSISNQLAHLPQNKRIGLDNINSKNLNIAAPIISSHLTRIINLSLNTGIFPTAWKSAK